MTDKEGIFIENVRVKVTTEIDFNLKWIFEATKDVHRKTYRDILEKGIEDAIQAVVTPEAIEARLKYREDLNAQDRDLLAKMRLLDPKQTNLEVQDEVDAQLDQWRVDKLLKSPGWAKKMWSEGTLNWARIVEVGEFKNKLEAKNWYREHLKEK